MATIDEYASILSKAVEESGVEAIDDRDKIYACARNTIRAHFEEIGNSSETNSRNYEESLLEAAIRLVEEGRYIRQGFVLDRVERIHLGFDEALGQTDLPNVSNLSGETVSTDPDSLSGHRKSKQFAANVGAATIVNIIRVLLQLITLPILARLLTPSDYGIYALALPTVSLFMLLADGGLGVSLARESEENRLLWSTAFWTLLGTCCLMGILVFSSGFVLSWISGERVLIGLMGLLSLSLPLLAFTVIADARLIRRGNLLFHCGADLCGLLTGAAAGLFIAFHGGGAWSLAAQYLSSLAVRGTVLNLAAKARPHFEYDFSTLADHLSIGGWLIVMRVSETVGKIIETSLFGRLFGPNLLGSYTLAFQLVRFSCESVTNPILSAFYAHAVRHDSLEVGKMHLFLSRLILIILVPVAVFLSIVAPKVLPSVLGEQWGHAAVFVQIFMVPYAIAGASWLSGQILLRNGIVVRNTYLTVAINIFRVLAIACGIWLDSFLVAWILAASYVVQAVALTIAVPDGLGADKGELLHNFLTIFLSAAVAGGVVYYIDNLIAWGWLAFTAEGLTGFVIYFGVLVPLQKNIFHSDFRSLIEFKNSFRKN